MRIVIFLSCLLMAWPIAVIGAEDAAFEVGLRGSLDESGTREDYVVREIYLAADSSWEIPVEWLSGWRVRFEAGTAHVRVSGDDGLWLAVGAMFAYPLLDDRVELNVGWRPTWLPDYRFGRDHFGGQMQFSTYVGVALKWQQVRWSYCFQHTSNAGLYSENPGLDLHMAGVGFRF